MKVLISYRGAPRIRGWETGAFVAKAFRSLHFHSEVYEYAKIYEQPEWVDPSHQDMRQKEYDLHIFMECNDPDRQYTELKYVNAKRRVAWLFDVAMQPDSYKRLVEHMGFDHCYLGNPDFLGQFSCPTSYLPYAADPVFAAYRHTVLDTNKPIDVCLVGSDRSERRDLIEKLQKAGINAQLIHGVFKYDYIKTLSNSRIVINDLAGGGANLLSMRTFEAPMADALLLQAKPPGDVLPKEVPWITYENEDELIELCRYYINDWYRRTWATSDIRRAIEKTEMYTHRVKSITYDR